MLPREARIVGTWMATRSMTLPEEALPDIGKDRPRSPERDVAAPVDG